MDKRIRSICSMFGFLKIFALGMVMVFLAGCVQPETGEQSQQTGKRDGLPVKMAEVNLKRGLSAVYFHDKFRHVDDMPVSEGGIAKFARSGPPILKLDNQFGKGEVFESGRSQEIGILMDGFL
ncbi:MAG TPA: hypothetical protein ENO11_00545, partial [Desulfobacteraceae bacterium]|nr:hypothetical protein [Desulfobacteraceae bacterium]